MVQLEYLRYFNSKCENESLLVILHSKDGACLSRDTLTGGHLSNFFIGFTIQIHLKWN